jgi:cytochrome c556
MKRPYGLAAVAAVIVTAACNGGGESNNSSSATTDAQENQIVQNVVSGAATPADHRAVMKARHDHYEEMGRAMKGIGDQLKAGSPDMAVIQRHADTVAGFGPQIPGWFPAGSGPEAGKTRAKAEIWSDGATFTAATQRFQQASTQFQAAARGGDVAAVRAALPALRESCSNCHDKFRGPDND